MSEEAVPQEIQDKQLTLKQRRFVIEFLKDGNGTQAAIRAGYSENVAHQQAAENLKKPCIVKKLNEHMDYAESALDITAHRILEALWVNHTTAEKMSDSNKALELLGRYHSMFTDKVEHSGDIPPAKLVVELIDERSEFADDE